MTTMMMVMTMTNNMRSLAANSTRSGVGVIGGERDGRRIGAREGASEGAQSDMYAVVYTSVLNIYPYGQIIRRASSARPTGSRVGRGRA
jgi:hypothetical protein